MSLVIQALHDYPYSFLSVTVLVLFVGIFSLWVIATGSEKQALLQNRAAALPLEEDL